VAPEVDCRRRRRALCGTAGCRWEVWLSSGFSVNYTAYVEVFDAKTARNECRFSTLLLPHGRVSEGGNTSPAHLPCIAVRSFHSLANRSTTR